VEWLTIVGPVVTAICALIGTYMSNRKTTALLEYRMKKVEEKIGQHNNLEGRIIALETHVHDLHAS